MNELPKCVSCGMPLRTAEDHAMGDPSRDYCGHCARPDGSMKGYDEARASMTQFLRRTQGLDETVADQMARQMMEGLPAWRNAGKKTP